MLSDFRKHFFDYFILVSILGLFFLLFIQNRGIPAVQYRLGVLASVSYFIWGIVHHYSEDNLNFKIVIEYALLAFLVIVILRGVFL